MTFRPAAWFMQPEGAGPEDWAPLWSCDSDFLEQKHQEGALDKEVSILNRRALASLSTRTVNHLYSSKPKKSMLRRGSWFWETNQGKSSRYVPFSEDAAEAIAAWNKAVLMSSAAGAGRWEHDLGEVLGHGLGQYTIVARLQRKAAVVSSSDEKQKDEAGGLEKAAVQVKSVLDDSSCKLVYSLENRTSLLSSIVSSSVSVREGFMLTVHPDEREAHFRPGHLVFVVHGIGEAMFSQDSVVAPSIQACTQKIKSICFDATHPYSIESPVSTLVGFDIDQKPLTEEQAAAEKQPRQQKDVLSHRYVDYIAVEWWNAVHGDELDITKQTALITPPTVPLMRQFGNTAAMDILLYQTPEFQKRITESVCKSLNTFYQRYCQMNPEFCGACSIIGHSLGSVISFDILSSQPSPGSDSATEPLLSNSVAEKSSNYSEKDNSKKGSSNGTESVVSLDETVGEISGTVLSFRPKAFYAIGSPIGIFYTIRSRGQPFPPGYRLPTCPRMYNIFHPLDPVAYRLEPLFEKQLSEKEPCLVEHSEGMRLHYKIKKFGAEVAQGFDTISNALSGSWFSSAPAPQPASALATTAPAASSAESGLFSSWFKGLSKTVLDGTDSAGTKVATVDGVLNRRSSAHAWSSMEVDLHDVLINAGRRVDYVLQESTFEVANPYVSALFAHSSYFENKDFAM